MVVFSNNNEQINSKELIRFLKKTFALNDEAINLAIKKSKSESAPIAIILKTFGMISLSQYQTLLDWIDQNY